MVRVVTRPVVGVKTTSRVIMWPEYARMDAQQATMDRSVQKVAFQIFSIIVKNIIPIAS